MRLIGTFLVLLGLVATVVGVFSGCNALFTWNGRHAIESRELTDVAISDKLEPSPGRRYTISVEVVFDRQGLPRRDGVVAVDAKMPLVVHVRDAAGTTLAKAVGWLDPNEPPNVLYGQAARENTRRPMPELVVSRLVGPFGAASAAPLTIEINLGPDRVGSARILARRYVIHDDALPAPIRNSFIGAGAGALCLLGGLAIFAVGWFRRRRTPGRPRRNVASP